MANTISAGSYSRLRDFEACQYRAKLKYLDKIPEPDRGTPPKGQREWANDRGSRLHDEAEQFVRGNSDTLPRELESFSVELHQARALFADGLATTEEMWCYDKSWKPIDSSDFKRTKFRIKADLSVVITSTHHAVIDYKTGKRYGNEISHEQQKQIYAIGMFLRNPELTKVSTELYYFDLPDEDVYTSVLTRSQAIVLLKGLSARVNKMLTATHFKPNPNKFTCRWCPYSKNACKYGV